MIKIFIITFFDLGLLSICSYLEFPLSVCHANDLSLTFARGKYRLYIMVSNKWRYFSFCIRCLNYSWYWKYLSLHQILKTIVSSRDVTNTDNSPLHVGASRDYFFELNLILSQLWSLSFSIADTIATGSCSYHGGLVVG